MVIELSDIFEWRNEYFLHFDAVFFSSIIFTLSEMKYVLFPKYRKYVFDKYI